MTSVNYPSHSHLRFEHRRAARVAGDKERRSPGQGMDTCTKCGHAVIAPSTSMHLPTGQVANHWQCSVCGHAWDTFAYSPTKK
jgi:ribosomal protein L37AE/L43A